MFSTNSGMMQRLNQQALEAICTNVRNSQPVDMKALKAKRIAEVERQRQEQERRFMERRQQWTASQPKPWGYVPEGEVAGD